MNVTEQSGESHIDIPESHQLPGPRPVGEGTFWEGRFRAHHARNSYGI